jgi:molybdate transport system regulatory protein
MSASRSRNRAAGGSPKGGARAKGRNPRPEIKLQINLRNGARLGPGKVRLLELIDSEGSLSRGAEKMGLSYRRAWLFVQQINEAFDQPSITTPEGGHGGGPARLTEFGRELVRKYRDMEAITKDAADQTLSWLGQHA